MRDRIAGKKHTKLQSGDSGFGTAGLKRWHFHLKKVTDPASDKRCRILWNDKRWTMCDTSVMVITIYRCQGPLQLRDTSILHLLTSKSNEPEFRNRGGTNNSLEEFLGIHQFLRWSSNSPFYGTQRFVTLLTTARNWIWCIKPTHRKPCIFKCTFYRYPPIYVENNQVGFLYVSRLKSCTSN